jgi:hypothetical protein
MLKLGAIAAALLVSLVLVAEADARGGSGTVTTFGVGPLTFDVSGLGDVAAFAGEPDKIVYQDNQGTRRGSFTAMRSTRSPSSNT